MAALVEARGLTKRYGSRMALDEVNFTIGAGRIVGLIGANGAGKTTAVRAILGLTNCAGHLRVLGFDPFRQRAALMREACFIADVAVMPSWLKVGQAVSFAAGVHPRFRRERAHELLAAARISPRLRMHDLSKGTKTQVHLALAMAIDAKLLVLDEPTLGLDPLARRMFFDALVNDYMSEMRTILITTNQVEEIEHLLTDIMFMEQGRIVLNAAVEELAARYAALTVHPECVPAARAQHPFHECDQLGRRVMYFEGPESETLTPLGELRTPSIADLFMAKAGQRP